MQIEMLPKLLNNINLMHAINVDPCDRWFASEGKALLNFVNLFLLKMGFIEVHYSDFHFLAFLFAYIDDSSWRKPFFF